MFIIKSQGKHLCDICFGSEQNCEMNTQYHELLESSSLVCCDFVQVLSYQ